MQDEKNGVSISPHCQRQADLPASPSLYWVNFSTATISFWI